MSVNMSVQGGDTVKINYVDDMMVGDALYLAQVEPSKKATFSVNGKDASVKTHLHDGDTVVVVRNGSVKFTVQGGETKEVSYTDGMTVKDVSVNAGTKIKRKAFISVNGEDATPDTPLNEDDSVVVSPKPRNG